MCGVLRGQVRNTSLKRSFAPSSSMAAWPSNLNFGLFTRKFRYSRFLVSFPSVCTTVHLPPFANRDFRFAGLSRS